jgi:hypothetical protein
LFLQVRSQRRFQQVQPVRNMFGEVISKIGGRNRVLKFNLNANYEFCKMHGLTPDEVMDFCVDAHNVTALRDLIYCALKVADLASGQQVDYNQFTVGEWIAEMPQADFEKIILGSSDANANGKGKKKAVKGT